MKFEDMRVLKNYPKHKIAWLFYLWKQIKNPS